MRFFHIISFILLFSITASAQEFNFGVHSGLIGSQVDGDNLEGFHKVGFFGGIFVNREFNANKDNFQMEFNFIQKGSRQNENPELGIYNKYIMRLNYIEIPILYTNKLHKFMWVQGGLKFAYLINSTELDSYGEIPYDPTVPEFRNLDYSIFIGLNSKVYKNIRAILRYSYSVRVIREHESNAVYYLNRGQRNEVITLALQYQF